MDSKTIYIHYGSDQFVTPRPIMNEIGWTKPKGGLWASRKNDEFGWIDWCKQEEFRLETFDRFFEFTLKDGAKVLELINRDQLDILPKERTYFGSRYNKSNPFSWCNLDFEELLKTYDAIELMDIHQFYFPLYGWDCNCILVMNPDIVEVLERRDIKTND